MNSLYLRSGLALLCAATLAACGGGSGNMALGGYISGLTKPGLTLSNGGDTVSPAAGDAGFSFTKLIATDAQFDIEITQQPTGAVCTIANNKNQANVYTVRQTQVSCTTNTATLGGTVSGLDGVGLVLANGSDTVVVSPPAHAGDDVIFTFPAKVADGAPFGVTVLAQPQGGKTCVASNNTGIMPAGDAKGLIVSCK